MGRCIDCRYFRAYGGLPLEILDPEDVGECAWLPDEPLPLTWRYALREVTAATAGATGCPAFKRHD